MGRFARRRGRDRHGRDCVAIGGKGRNARGGRRARSRSLGGAGARSYKGGTKPGLREDSMKRTIAPVVALVCAVVAPAAGADEIVLKFATLDQPEAHHTVAIHRPW